MCVIFQLRPGYTLPKEVLSMAVHNNPHGYGVVVKREGKLTVFKELPEGGNNPDVIYQILKDNEDAERFVHVRWKTAGSVSIENTQPFLVYDDRGRQIWFMHNGTLSGYTPPYTQGMSASDVSDSRKFATEILQKFLPKFIGDNGIADYLDPVVTEFIEKQWSHGNKGILICNDLDPYFLGLRHWEVIKTTETVKVDGEDVEVQGNFFASNNEYFEGLKRGPLFDKLEAEKRKAEQEEKEKRKEKVANFLDRVNPDLTVLESPEFSERFSLGEAIVDLLEDFDMYSASGYIALANVTYAEWITMLKKIPNDDVASLFLYLTDFLKTNTERLQDLEKVHSELAMRHEALSKEKEKAVA